MPSESRSRKGCRKMACSTFAPGKVASTWRSEEHTSELQSLRHIVCRLLLEKKKCGAYVGFGRTVAAIGIHFGHRAPLELDSFCVRQELLTRQLRRKFDRRHSCVCQQSFEVR